MTNKLPMNYLLISLRNNARTIMPREARNYGNPVAVSIERNRKYWVNQERCTSRPQLHPGATNRFAQSDDDALKSL